MLVEPFAYSLSRNPQLCGGLGHGLADSEQVNRSFLLWGKYPTPWLVTIRRHSSAHIAISCLYSSAQRIRDMPWMCGPGALSQQPGRPFHILRVPVAPDFASSALRRTSRAPGIENRWVWIDLGTK
jgi:hypothetical protein